MMYLIYENADEMTQLFIGIFAILCILFMLFANLYFWIKKKFGKRELGVSKLKDWEENYKDDIEWEDFDENYLFCSRCKEYNKGQCICYAR